MRNKIILFAAAVLLAAALPGLAAEDRTDFLVVAAAGTQQHAFRTDADGASPVIRHIGDFDFRRWSGGAEVGIRHRAAVVTAGASRSHTFAPDADEDAGAWAATAGVGIAAAIGARHIAILARAQTGAPDFSERHAVGLGGLVIGARWVAGADWWPATERAAIRFGVAF